MHLNKRTDGGSGYYEDTHNYYIKVLAETGMVGLLIFLALLAQMFAVAFRLFRTAEDPFFASIGLGLIGWLVCCAVANFFGDRWTFLQVNGYLWVLGGMASQALALEKEAADGVADAGPETVRCEPSAATLPPQPKVAGPAPLASLYESLP